MSDVLDAEQFSRYQGLVNASRAGGNPVFLPPGTPEEIVELWREAWVEAYTAAGTSTSTMVSTDAGS